MSTDKAKQNPSTDHANDQIEKVKQALDAEVGLLLGELYTSLDHDVRALVTRIVQRVSDAKGTEGQSLEEATAGKDAHPFTVKDDRILSDVDCMVTEAAVILKYAHADFVKDDSINDAEKLQAIDSIDILVEQLQEFEGTFAAIHSDANLLSDVEKVLDIVGKHARNLTPQIDGLTQYAEILDSGADRVVLIYAAWHLLRESKQTLIDFKERHENSAATGTKEISEKEHKFRDRLQWSLATRVRNINATLELLTEHVYDVQPQADEVTVSTVVMLRDQSQDCMKAAMELADEVAVAQKFEEWNLAAGKEK